MNSAPANYQTFIAMMEAFVSRQNTSPDFVSQMERQLATTGLDDDERFRGLQSAFAMFGASIWECDEKMLAAECKYALGLLRNEQGTCSKPQPTHSPGPS